MHNDCVTTPEVTSFVGAGGLVGTYEAVAMFEVGVLVPLDLPRVRVPVPTVSDPAEDRIFPVEVDDRPRFSFPAEVCDCPRITISIIAPVGFINTTPTMVVLEDSAARARFQNWHLSDVLNRHLGGVTQRSPKSTGRDRGMHVFPMPFGNMGGTMNGS